MDFIQHAYFNFFTIGALIPMLFTGLLAYFFITMKNKSRASGYYSVFLILTTLFFASYVAAAAFDHPFAAYHRWGTIVTCIMGMVCMALAVLNFPDHRFPRFEKGYLMFWVVVYLAVSFFFYHESFHSSKVFHFAGHYWDFAADRSSRVYGLALVISILMIMVMGFVRLAVNKGVERWAAFFIGAVTSFAFFIPGILNLISRDGLMDRGTYQISQNLSTITGLFIATIIYLNVTKDRSKFMSKILIVTLATLLILVQGFSYFSLQQQERSFDDLIRKDTTTAIHAGIYPGNMDYMVSYFPDEDRIETKYKRNNEELEINFQEIRPEFKNTFIYERIKELSPENFKDDLAELLEKGGDHFQGYRKAIIDYADDLPSETENPASEVLKYIDSIERPVLFTRTKISRLPNSDFAENLLEFLPGAGIHIFNEAITAHLESSTSEGSDLKEEILVYLSPMRAAGSRIYRKGSCESERYVSVMEYDSERNGVVEAGFPYLNYREYVHDISKMYIIMLLIMVVVLFAGFPLFFWGSLIKPIRNLLAGLREMQRGNLKVQIPVRVEDEFGFMSRTFNTMAGEIRSATENLEDKVNARTEELRAAMEEMEAINEQLLETRDALWGEMELAKKIQMKLLPEDPSIADYEITAFMEPAEEVGGDYYDVINVAGMDWVVIGDVSGHGVPAGLIMMMAQTAIHVALDQNPDISPDNLLEVVNKTISKNIKMLGEDKYMTITVLAASKGGKFIFSGLHQDIMVYRSSTGRVDLVETRGMWIGIVDDLKGMLEVDSLAMEPGDIMFLYSDGITEARRKDYEKGIETYEFGEERLIEFFKNHAGLPVHDIKNELLKKLEGYRCGDDVTMVLLKRKA